MNTKQDKIELLKAIAAGEIDPRTLSPESVIVSNGKEAYYGLMMTVARKKDDKKPQVIYVGEAKDLIETSIQSIKEKRDEGSRPQQKTED